jgi:tetratricopeptide (TPR) repeat protein
MSDQLDPNHQEGNRWIARRELDSAADAFRQSSILNPGHYLPHLSLGAALVEMGRTAEAVSSYSIALKIKPGDFHAHFNMGVAMAKVQIFSVAIEHFQMASRATPLSFEAHFSLGESVFGLGLREQDLGLMLNKFSEATQHYEAALAIRSQNPHCIAKLAKLAQLMTVTSLEDVQRVLSATTGAEPATPATVKMDRRGMVTLKGSGREEQTNALLQKADGVMYGNQKGRDETVTHLLKEVGGRRGCEQKSAEGRREMFEPIVLRCFGG